VMPEITGTVTGNNSPTITIAGKTSQSVILKNSLKINNKMEQNISLKMENVIYLNILRGFY
jgi:hypothetical protein